MPRTRLLPALFSCLLLLAGCGGGGGGGGGGGDDSPLLASLGLLDFGEVMDGAEREIAFTIRNPEAQAITINSVTLPSGSFTLTGASFPVTLVPSQTLPLSLSYRPAGYEVVNGRIEFSHDLPPGVLSLRVIATTSGEEIVDFGSVPLTGGVTPELGVEVPADAISLTLEGWGTDSDEVDLRTLIGPGGRIYKNSISGDYLSRENDEIFSTTIPNTDRSALDLVPGGGTYLFRLETGPIRSSLKVRAIIERRPQGFTETGTLDLNVWLALSLPVFADTAASDSRLQDILETMDTVLSQQGIRLGRIDYYDMTDLDYDFLSREEFPEMLRITERAQHRRLNLFFVRELYSPLVVGVSPTISAPARNGTGSSGMAVVYDTGLRASTIGAVAAHEAGHVFGLYHTVESDGTHDIIDDTPDCPAIGTNAECNRDGGGLLMHWEFLGGLKLTDGQGKVLRAHPLLSPGTGSSGATTLLLLPPIDPLPEGWCGECSR